MSQDRLRKSLDWNRVVAALDEVTPEADSISIFAAEAWIDKSSRLSTNVSRLLQGPAMQVFDFMSMRNQRKLPASSAMQTHEPKMKVVP
jgi:hypothetical protein